MCKRGCTGFRQLRGVPAYTCGPCDYDLCDLDAAFYVTRAWSSDQSSVVVSCHPHPLVRGVRTDGRWACDGRSARGGCKKGITDFNQTAGLENYCCIACDYDLCLGCVLLSLVP